MKRGDAVKYVGESFDGFMNGTYAGVRSVDEAAGTVYIQDMYDSHVRLTVNIDEVELIKR